MSSLPHDGRAAARFTLFELLRRIERSSLRMHEVEKSVDPGPRADGVRPAWLRIEQPAALHFAGSEVVDVQVRADPAASGHAPAEILVRQRPFGLFAPYGPLPIYVTEHAMAETSAARNAGFEAFINLISGDFAWLHYRAWSSMHPVLGHERVRHPFAERLGMLAALMPGGNRAAPDPGGSVQSCRRAWPGSYIAPQRPFSVLARMLRAMFGVAIVIRPRTGRWLDAPPRSTGRRRIGAWRLGSRLLDAQTSAEIVVGPLDATDFPAWQRRSSRVRALVEIAVDYAHGRLRPLVCVLVRIGPAHAARIGVMQTGTNAWLRPASSVHPITVHHPEDPS